MTHARWNSALRRSLPCLLFLAGTSLSGAADEPSADQFASPPSSAAPQTWWHWMNGNVTKEGITADLEAMKRVGLGGATVVNISYVPRGKVDFMGDAWRRMLQHAVRESARLGLHLGVENCGGWTSSGGPWITPEKAMQVVSVTTTDVKGPTEFSGMLPQPLTRLGFYHDIAVLAFPTPDGDAPGMADAAPRITSSDPRFDGGKLLQARARAELPAASRQKPQYVQFEFARPFAVRTVVLSLTSGYSGEFQASDDGQHFRTLRPFTYEVSAVGPPMGPNAYEITPTSARFCRVEFREHGELDKDHIGIERIDLEPHAAIDDFLGKADYIRSGKFSTPSAEALPQAAVIDPARVVNLTGQLSPAGHLTWKAPPGKWTVLRIGYTPTGINNHPAPVGGEGLECDKLSREAVKFHWDRMMAEIIADSGPLAGKTLNHTLIDSYEVGSENWTAALPQEFQKRQGYDLTPFLPALAGWVVGSPEQSERALWDFRRTVADLFAHNYFDYMSELAQQAGLQLNAEPYGDGPFDNLLSGAEAGVPMGEFWVPSELDRSLKDGPMISHIYGRKLAGAESFTSQSRWQESPASLKPVGDFVFTCGINQLTFHRFTHQPWLDRVPGMTAGPWGSCLERTNTWWEQSRAWIRYLTRCQYLLQQGLFAADVLVLGPEGSPAGFPSADVPTGYDWDGCNDDVVLHRLYVSHGRLVLPDGMSYRLLMLPPGTDMTPELLQKLKSLADDGATIIGPQPTRSRSLRGYPRCDEEVRALANELWQSGKISSRPLPGTLAALNLPPDFECVGTPPAFPYIHRIAGQDDVYFVCNRHGLYAETDGLFRVSGKVPEFWHPDTGKIEPVSAYTEENGRTRVPLRLDPDGSVFVIFRPGAPGEHPVALTREGGPSGSHRHDRLEITRAVFSSISNPESSADVTAKANALVKNGSLASVVNQNVFGDPAPMEKKQLQLDYTLNGAPAHATFREGEEIQIPSTTARAEFSDAELVCADAGQIALHAWTGGDYQVRTASGKTLSMHVEDVPPVLMMDGPWQLTFPPGRGAPPQASFDHLMSWSNRPEPGIKYFSGTATYSQTFSVPPSLVGPGHRLYLDLGQVEVIAEVKLNGKNLGILWKPPFGLDVADAVRAGKNSLEIEVTNLWVNRLIGDDQLPADCDWDNPKASQSGPKEWPQWLLDDKPSPTGRITFTAWHLWHKDEPLKKSGLLGPVVLIPSVIVPVR